MGRIGRTIQEGSVYALLLLLPFSKAAIEVLFGVMLLGWLLERADRTTRADTLWRGPRLRLLLIMIVGYLAVCALSIAVSRYPETSFRGFYAKWLEYLLWLVMVVDVGSRPHVISRSLVCLAWSSGLVLLEGVTQALFGKGLLRAHSWSVFRRMTGPYENPIDLATYLMVAIPIFAGYSLQYRRIGRAVLWILIAALFAVFLNTNAFGAWLGLCAALAIVAAANLAQRRYGLLGLLVGGVVLIGGLLYRTGGLQEVLSPAELSKVDRWMMWQAAIGMIRDHPILGHGVNTFMANYLDYWVGGEQQPRYAHNCYLQVAAETGLLGLTFFLGILGAMAARFLAGLRQSGPSRRVLLGYVIGLLAFALQSGIDTNFYSLRQVTLFFVLAGLALGLNERILREHAGTG